MSMSIAKVPDASRAVNFTFINNWPNPFRLGRYNWIDFYVLHCGFEFGRYKGKYLEFTLVIIGIGFCIEWQDTTSRAVFMADMDQRIAEAKEFLHESDDDDEHE